MSIVKMKKLQLIVLREQRDALMRELMRLGCVQIHKPEQMLSDPDVAAILQPERVDLSADRASLTSLQSALKVLEQHAPQKKKLLSARPVVKESEFLDDEALKADLDAAAQINALDAKLRRQQAEEGHLRSVRESLVPWQALDAPVSGAGTKTCDLLRISALAQTDMSAVSAAVASVTEAAQIIPVLDDDKQHCFAVVAMKPDVPAVLDALVRDMGCTQIRFDDMVGFPAECIAQIDEQLDAILAEQQGYIDQIISFAPRAAALRLSADRMAAQVSRSETVMRLSGTENIVVLEGWCPAPDADALVKVMEGFDCAWNMTDPDESEYPDVPVKLKNSRLVHPMNVVTEMYSLPAYDGVDPNPLMWPFFILFYGIMMADMGYGILMMIAAVVVLKKSRPSGGFGNLVSLIGMCGISTFIFGALTGGFFGDFLPQLAKLINPDTTFTSMPYVFSPLNDTIMILLGSLALGVVQIFTGMIVNVVEKFKRKQFLSALFNEGSWWFILFGVAALFFLSGVMKYLLLIIGCVLLVVGQFWEKKSFMGGITGLFGAIYNGVTGYFSDILSYSRLMALMLAGSVIATVFNTLGALTGNIVTFVIIAFVGNALNFVLNILSCFVHDLRLQVLEFFGRFYKEGGKPFKPLSVNTKYVEIVKEEI